MPVFRLGGPRRRAIMGLVIGLLALLLVAVIVGSFFYWNGYYMMGAPYYPHPFFGFFFFPFSAVFFLLLVFLAVRLVFFPWRRGHYGHWGRWDDPHMILRQRYARGEITKEQFDQMTRDLEQHASKF